MPVLSVLGWITKLKDSLHGPTYSAVSLPPVQEPILRADGGADSGNEGLGAMGDDGHLGVPAKSL